MNSNINLDVTSTNSIVEAADKFRETFSSILDYHAPIRTIQLRNNYCPFLCEESKQLIRERNVLREQSLRLNDVSLHEEYRLKAKEARKAVDRDKRIFWEQGLSANSTTKFAWKTARSILGMSKNGGPNALKLENGDIIRNPKKMATELNNFFIKKVRKLRTLSSMHIPEIDPNRRLEQYLTSLQLPIPSFKIEEINAFTLRKLIKEMKGGIAVEVMV